MSLKVLKMWADWCRPCIIINPIFDKVASEFDDVKFEHVNVDVDTKVASEFRVMSIPTIIFLKDDVEVNRSVGMISENDLRDKVNELRSLV